MNSDQIYRDIESGLFTGESTTLPGLNKPFWARVTAFDGISAYSWHAIEPSGSGTQLQFTDVDGGRSGTATTCPLYAPNNEILPVPCSVLIRRAYFDASLDWVYVTVGAPAGSGANFSNTSFNYTNTTFNYNGGDTFNFNNTNYFNWNSNTTWNTGTNTTFFFNGVG